jgi:5-(aminomethyl)-3-furanmethanol phosphate kinase
MTWVIKLGGSLSNDRLLKVWLDMLAQHAGGKMVIVPGGGRYADAVRAAQRRWEFDDATAHRMALLAMEQYGVQFHGMVPSLVVADSITSINNALRGKKVPIWLPSAMLLSTADCAANWDITSDSLAAWLAKTIHAARLVLVKSCDVDAADSLADFRRKGIVDAAFEQMVYEAPYAIEIVSRSDWDSLRDRLASA